MKHQHSSELFVCHCLRVSLWDHSILLGVPLIHRPIGHVTTHSSILVLASSFLFLMVVTNPIFGLSTLVVVYVQHHCVLIFSFLFFFSLLFPLLGPSTQSSSRAPPCRPRPSLLSLGR